MSINRSDDGCPECCNPCGAPTLLTSMVRYYTCGECGHSWHVMRDHMLNRRHREGAAAIVDQPSWRRLQTAEQLPCAERVSPRYLSRRRHASSESTDDATSLGRLWRSVRLQWNRATSFTSDSAY